MYAQCCTLRQPCLLYMKKILPHHIVYIYLLLGCLQFSSYASGQSCNDTTSIITLSNSKPFYLQDQLTTRSGGRIYSGWFYQGSDTTALLLYYNAQGNVQWARSYKNDALARSYFFRVTELHDGNFIVSGKTINRNGDLEYLLLAKFDAGGNFLWHRLYKPGTLLYTSGQLAPLQVTEDDSRSLYFSFYSISYNFSALARLDANGNMIWSRSFRYRDISLPQYAVAFMPTVVKNDTLYLAGIGAYRDQFTMKLNRNTGDLLSVKRFSLGTAMPAATFEQQNTIRVFPLQNGHYITVARLYYALPHEYFFVEWDEQLQFVKALALDMPYPLPQLPVYSFSVMPNGTIVAAAPYARYAVDPGFKIDRIYIAAFNTSQQQVFQKKVLLRRNDYRLNRLNDNCLAGTDQNGRLVLTPVFSDATQTAMDVYRYKPDGFHQDCIHDEDTVFTGTSPQTMQETPFSFDEIASNVLQQVPAMAGITNETFTKQVYCESAILCDRLTIKGPSLVCVEHAPAVFTASKNEHCPLQVNWHIDNPGADSIRQINDTTILVYFSKAWQGQITASLEGCSLTDTFRFTANKAMPARLAADNSTQLCIGENDTLSPGNNYLSYLWQNGSVDQKMVVESPGVYWVKVADSNGCTSSDTVTVTALHDLPDNFMVTDTTVCIYSSIKLQPEGDFIAWRWSTGETTPSITVHQQGTYTISVTDRNYCTGTARVTVTAMPCSNHIFFPNAFSPNGDGKNDLFKPTITGNLLNYRMQIYNRWGQKIFESTNAATGWNGKTGSILQPPGIYVWQAIVQFAGESRRLFKGTTALVP